MHKSRICVKHLKEAGATVELKAVYGIGYKLVEE